MSLGHLVLSPPMTKLRMNAMIFDYPNDACSAIEASDFDPGKFILTHETTRQLICILMRY
jgi:hypothetical protein